MEYAPGQNLETFSGVEEALKPLDKLAAEMEQRWGVGRLPRLVSAETAAKFGMAMDKLKREMLLNHAEGVAQRVPIMMRGWQALEKEALANGHKPNPEGVIGYKHEKQAWTIVVQDADLHAASLYAPEPEYVVTISELLICYEQAHKAARKAKKAFPGSRVVRVAQKPFDDPLPF
mgnify:CR=1 FL=1